jgi:hypothetical protein
MTWNLTRSLNLRRGFVAAFVGGFGGAFIGWSLELLYKIREWQVGELQHNHEIEVYLLDKDLLWTSVGCSIICACAGWATFAPAGKWSFLRSLAFVVLAYVVGVCVAGRLELLTRRDKSMPHPAMYLSEAAACIGTPVLAAVLLTLLRAISLREGDVVNEKNGNN